MHAYGNPTLKRVFVVASGSGGMLLPPMNVREATQLQIQLGVAIGEACGQLKMDLVHDEQGECIACETPRYPNG